MPRGGARPGAGRKRKGVVAPVLPTAAQVAAAMAPTGIKEPESPASWPFGTQPEAPPTIEPPEIDTSKLTPLDFLLSVVRGETGADEKVRLQAAAIAAPFVHVKPVATKKEDATEAAKKAAGGMFSAPKTPPRLVSSR